MPKIDAKSLFDEGQDVNSLFEEGEDVVPPSEESSFPGELKAGAVGASQGLTFGTSDEMLSGLQAAKEWLTRQDSVLSPSYGDIYEKKQKENQAALEALKAEYPKSYMAGELGGGIAQGVALTGLTGGLGSGALASKLPMLAKLSSSPSLISRTAGSAAAMGLEGAGMGLAQGAAYGAGTAEQGKRLEGAKEGAKVGGVSGGVLGGGFGAVAPTLSKIGGAAREALSDSSGVRIFQRARERGLAGEKTYGVKAAAQADEIFKSNVNDLTNDLYKMRLQAGREIEDTLSLAPEKIPVNPGLSNSLMEWKKRLKTGEIGRLDSARSLQLKDLLKDEFPVKEIVPKEPIPINTEIPSEFQAFAQSAEEWKKAKGLPSNIPSTPQKVKVKYKQNVTINDLIKEMQSGSISPDRAYYLKRGLDVLIKKIPDDQKGLEPVMRGLRDNLQEMLMENVPEYANKYQQFSDVAQKITDNALGGAKMLGSPTEKTKKALENTLDDLHSGGVNSPAALNSYNKLQKGFNEIEEIYPGFLEEAGVDPNQFVKKYSETSLDKNVSLGSLKSGQEIKVERVGRPSPYTTSSVGSRTGNFLGRTERFLKPVGSGIGWVMKAPAKVTLLAAKKAAGGKYPNQIKALEKAVESNDEYLRTTALFSLLQNADFRKSMEESNPDQNQE